jgi:hypothetical protein|tara:strand:- start:1399 stop:1674 length:276 start_codon:yes stop_codon:yes gene_type:complete
MSEKTTVDLMKPANLIIGAILMVGAGSAGSMLGITIEPEETTLMRVESAKQAVTIEGLEQRVALLEEVVAECRRMMQLCTTPSVPSSTEVP